MNSLNYDAVDALNDYLEERESEWEYIWSPGGGRVLGFKIQNSLLADCMKSADEKIRAAARWVHDVQAQHNGEIYI